MLKIVSIWVFLGVIIDDQLKWSTHIESVEQKLQRLIGILYKIRYKLPSWCLRNIYFAFVYPRAFLSRICHCTNERRRREDRGAEGVPSPAD